MEQQNKLCPLCSRPLSGTTDEDHHLIPKTFKGVDTVRIHRICHQKIHSCFSERELLNYYHTVERLADHEEIKKFIIWVSKKSPGYYSRNSDTDRRKSRR